MKSITELLPWKVIEVKRDAIGLRGWVVIDAARHGFACGGVRMRAEVTSDEIANLAREMALKYQFLNIAKDGAKSGIVAPIDSPPERKKELCRAFGEELSKVIHDGLYTPGEDMGVGHHELDEIMAGAGFPPGVKQTPAELYTALTAVICFEEYCRWKNLPITQQRVSIEGYGKVGSCAGKLLKDLGARVVGISTALGAIYKPEGLDLAVIENLRRERGDALVQHYPGAEQLPREQLITRPTDYFMPGAQPDSINGSNLDSIQCRCMVSIANIAADQLMEERLHERGIDYFPGFVANCGGILAYYLREQGFAVDELDAFIRTGFAAKIRTLLATVPAGGSVAAASRALAAANGQALMQRDSALKKLFTPRRYGWLLYRNAGKGGLRNLLMPFARQYMRAQLFSS